MRPDTVLRAVLVALLALALAGAADARYIDNTSTTTGNSTFVIGEVNVTPAEWDASAGAEVVCTGGSIGGVTQTATSSVGNISITGSAIDTNGKGLVAGPYDVTCTGVPVPKTYRVTGVTPTYAASFHSAVAGRGAVTIGSIASGDEVQILASSNLYSVINGTNQPGTVQCTVDVGLVQEGMTANKLAGNSSYAGQSADVNQTLLTDTATYPAGTYDLSVSPSASSCNGLSASSGTLATLTVTTQGVTLTADKTTVGINDLVTLTTYTSPFKNVSLTLTSGAANRLRFSAVTADSFQQSNNAANTTTTALNTALTGGSLGMNDTSNVTAVADSSGKATFQVNMSKDGTYAFRVYLLDTNGVRNNNVPFQTVNITVNPVSATVKTDKTTAYPGQNVTISGTVTAGSYVVIAINDRAEAISQVQADKTFSYLWPASETKNSSTGSVKLEVWVCPQTVSDGTNGCANTGSGRLLLASLGETPTDTQSGICEVGNGSLYTGCNASQKKPADASWSIHLLPPTTFETGRAWVLVRPFLAQAYAPGFQWKFEVGKNMTFFVQACDGNFQWSPGGLACSGGNHSLNASATNLTKVIRNWAFDTPFRTQSTLTNTTVSSPNGSSSGEVRFDLNLTGWPSGDYYAEIQAVDANGTSVTTSFWFELAVASVAVTEAYPDLYAPGISTASPVSNLTSFNVTAAVSSFNPGDTSCGPGGNAPCWPNYTLPPDYSNNSFIGRGIQYVISGSATPVLQTRPWALLNSDNRTFHINFSSADFNNTSTVGIGGSFVDAEGRNWSVKNVTSDGRVELEGKNALASGHVVDLSLSKSGKFLLGQIWDDSWRQVDLDGNGSFSDSYWVLLADNRTPGTYDTVWVSNTSDFTAHGINASVFGAPVAFGGKPVYLTGLHPELGSIGLRFSSHRSAWDGYWLGQFEGGENVTLPFRVASPDGTVPKPGVNVTVDSLTTWSPTDPGTPIPGGPVSNTTDGNGIALLRLRTTGIQSGQYLVHYAADVGGTTISPGDKWRLPSIELRNFVATADPGTRGRINLTLLRPGKNLTALSGDTFSARSLGGWRCTPCANASLNWSGYQLDWPVNKYFNDTPGAADFGKLFDFNGQTNLFENATPANDSGSTDWDSLPVATGSGNILKFNVTRLVNYSSATDGTVARNGVNNNSSATYLGAWKMWAEASPNSTATLHVAYLPWGQNLDPANGVVGPHDDYFNLTNGSRIHSGPAAIEISEIHAGNGTVKFHLAGDLFRATAKALDEPRFFDGVPSNGEVDSRFPRVTAVRSGNFELYAFNNNTSAISDYRPGASGDPYSLPKESLVVEDLPNATKRFARVGEPLPELGSLAVVSTDRDWGSSILLTDLPNPIFPLPGWVENSTYYVGSFNESDVGVDLDNDFALNHTFYVLVYDQVFDGVFNPTSALLDGDHDFSQIFNNTNCGGMPCPPASCPPPPSPCLPDLSRDFDLFGPEGGTIAEQSISLYGGWPLNVVNRTFGPDNGSLTTLAQKFYFQPGEDLTYLARATYFNGTPLSGGTVNVSRAELQFGSDNGTSLAPKVLNLSGQGPWALQDGESNVFLPASALGSSENIPQYSHSGFSGNFRLIFEFTAGGKSETVERYIQVGFMGPVPATAGGGGGVATPAPSP